VGAAVNIHEDIAAKLEVLAVLEALLERETEEMFLLAWNATWTVRECADMLPDGWDYNKVFHFAKRIAPKYGNRMRPGGSRASGRNTPNQRWRWEPDEDGQWVAVKVEQ
jgi:hypothetical protein